MYMGDIDGPEFGAINSGQRVIRNSCQPLGFPNSHDMLHVKSQTSATLMAFPPVSPLSSIYISPIDYTRINIAYMANMDVVNLYTAYKIRKGGKKKEVEATGVEWC